MLGGSFSREGNVDLREFSQRPNENSLALTPERALELKAKARALFAQGANYSLRDDGDLRSLTRAKPVWE